MFVFVCEYACMCVIVCVSDYFIYVYLCIIFYVRVCFRKCLCLCVNVCVPVFKGEGCLCVIFNVIF